MPDSGKTIYCEQLRSAGRWHGHQRIQINASGMITAVSSGEPHPGDEILSGWVIPGMPNLHSHGFQYLLAGRTGFSGAGQDSFWTWRELMYRLVEEMNPEQFEAVTAWCYLQLLKGGYTSVAEFHYVHNDKNGKPYDDRAEMSNRVISAASQTGIGLTLLPVLYCYAGFGEQQYEPRQAAFVNSLESYLEIQEAITKSTQHDGLLYSGAAPHSLRAVSEQLLTELLAALPGEMPLHIHVAEQRNEIEASVAFSGQRPVEWLLDHFSVDERWCLVHATHMSESELQRAAASGAIAGLCPTTEADLGDGIFSGTDWQAARGMWGIGSDSNLRTGAAEELRLFEFTQRLQNGQRNVMTRAGSRVGDSLHDAAMAGGGRATGQPVGLIEPGYRADFVQLGKNHPLLGIESPDGILDLYIFANSERMITRVLVAGQTVVEHGRHINEDLLREKFETVARNLL